MSSSIDLYTKHLGYVRWGVVLIIFEGEIGSVNYFNLDSNYDGSPIK